MFKLIGLDFDGVIIRGSNEAYFDCYHKALEAVGVALDPKIERERILERWGMGHREQLELLLKEKSELVQKAAATFVECVNNPAFDKKTTLISGVREAITKFRQSYKVVIVSGTGSKTIKKFLKEHDIDVDGVYSSYDVEDPSKRKPHPFLLELAMKKFGAKPKETIFVGDMDNDVEMAIAAGVEPIVVLTGHLNESEAKRLGVRKIIKQLSELNFY